MKPSTRNKKTYQTDGIVLSRREIGETDRILTVFTRERGIVRLKARGVRKIKSRLAGHVELFTEAKFFIAEGRGSDDVLAGAETKRSHEAIRGDLNLMAEASLVAEFALLTIPFGVKATELYDLSLWALGNLETKNDKTVAMYLWRLLYLSGFVSDLKDCAHCHQPLEAANIEFLADEARFSHRRCRADRTVLPESLKLIRLLTNGEWGIVTKLKVPAKVTAETTDLASMYVMSMVKKPLVSAHFVKRLGAF